MKEYACMCSWKLINLNLPKKKIGLLLSFIFIINSTYDLIKLQIVANTCIPVYMFARRKLRDKYTYTSDFNQIKESP